VSVSFFPTMPHMPAQMIPLNSDDVEYRNAKMWRYQPKLDLNIVRDISFLLSLCPK